MRVRSAGPARARSDVGCQGVERLALDCRGIANYTLTACGTKITMAPAGNTIIAATQVTLVRATRSPRPSEGESRPRLTPPSTAVSTTDAGTNVTLASAASSRFHQ